METEPTRDEQRLMTWLNDRVLDPVTTPTAAVDLALQLLPEACGEDHDVGDKPDECYACLAFVRQRDIDWLRALVNNDRRNRRAYGKINRYTCKICEDVCWTIDVDEGVTPMMIDCRMTAGCGGLAVSACYKVGEPGQAGKPTHRWVRPMSLVGLESHAVDHVEFGGLILEEIP